MTAGPQPTTSTQPTKPTGPGGPIAPQIPYDLPCASCGYNLRTLRMNARCPECGETVTNALPRPIDRVTAAEANRGLVWPLMGVSIGVLLISASLTLDDLQVKLIVTAGLVVAHFAAAAVLTGQTLAVVLLLGRHGQRLREAWAPWAVLGLAVLAVTPAMLLTVSDSIWVRLAVLPAGVGLLVPVWMLVGRLRDVLDRATGSVASLRPVRSLRNKWRD